MLSCQCDNMTKTNLKKRAVAVAVASCLSFAPWLAEAAGLGKLTVLSGLGQPLRAEIEINATRAELAGMSARLAPQKAFREAGIDYATALYDLRFAIDKRPNGTSVLKITSGSPVNDPFMDLLVELSWPDGPVVREYTFLLDPPEVAAKAAGRPVSTAEARVVETVRGAAAPAATSTPATRAEAPRSAPVVPKAAPEPKKTQEAGTHLVQQGETLRRIAGETKHEGVSLEQMLIGLYKKNPDAFIGDNINRLKAGAILNIPDKATVAAVSAAEARQVYQAQASDWNAYRQRLAGAVAQGQAKPEDASQSASGKIAARVDEKATSAGSSSDQVKVSKAETAAKGATGGKSAAAAEEDLIAKDRALKEAQDRLAQLEKNVGELQKLVDMKTQRLAELQQQASGKKDEAKPAATVAPVEAAKPATPAEPPKAAESVPAAEPPKAAEAPKPVEEPPKVAETPKPVEPPKAPEVKAPEAPKPVAPAPEPESDLLPLIGGGGLIALLAGYFLMRRRRSEPEPPMTTAAPGPASLGPNSVFRMTGGQSVDTGNVPLQTGEFSQTGPGTIDTDEVDPVAEADVYMAYGRDAQAEEILVEALRKDPHRTAIHAKLLEIYSTRKSVKQFETLASELYAQTGGVGADWEKVAAMGAALDPANPLYSSGESGVTKAPEAGPTQSSIDGAKSTVLLPGALGAMAAATVAATEQLIVPELPQDAPDVGAAASAESDHAQAAMSNDAAALDFDLDAPVSKPEMALQPEPMSMPEMEALDFDLGTSAQDTIAQSFSSDRIDAAATGAENNFSATTIADLNDAAVQQLDFAAAEPSVIDFQLDTAASLSDTVVNSGFVLETSNDQTTIVDGSAGMSATQVGGVEDFDINLSESVFIGQPMMTSDFDMTTINLDLGAESADSTQVVSFADNSGNLDSGSGQFGGDEVATKLALAKAYEEMGDHSQARELLEEVISEGNNDLAQQARDMIDRLRG